MAVDQPPVDDALLGMDSEASSVSALGDVGAGTEFWRTVLPWDDLSAKTPPGRHLEFQRDIQAALAVLVAQGPDRPRLLATDTVGRLQTAGGLNPVQRLTQPLAVGGNAVFVDSVIPFAAGAYVMLTGAPGSVGVTTSGPFRILNLGSLGFTIVGQTPVPYSVGDLAVALPMVEAIGDGYKDRPVDSALESIAAAGAAATLTFPATPNQVWQLAYVAASLRQTGATAGVCTVEVWDGPSGTGTRRFSHQLAVDVTVGHADRLPMLRLPIKSTRGNALTVDTTGPGATGVVDLAAGCWQSVDRGVSE